jgi:hypothetical protein
MEWLSGKAFSFFLVLLALLGVHPHGAAQTNGLGTASGVEPLPVITVYKTAMCGCCTQWVEHLQADGFKVQVETVEETHTVQSNLGVPQQLGSCHTAVVGNYWVEGHVPADLIWNLLEEKLANVKGIAVPGMVPGSPGMESPQPMQFQVLSVDDQGRVAVYAVSDGDSQH